MNTKDDLLQKIDELLSIYCADEALEKESLEWYLKNHLVSLVSYIKGGSKVEIERASRLLVRFCVDTMDWESDLYKQASVIGDAGVKLSKSM